MELDKKSLVTESVDRILDSLTQDSKSLLDWLTDSVTEQLNSGGKFSLEQELYNTAEALRNDEHNDLVEKYGIDENAFCSRESLKALKKECDDVVDAFVGKVKKLAGEIVSGLDGNIDLFFRGFGTPLSKCAALKRGEKCPVPSDNFLKNAADKKCWLKKPMPHACLNLRDGLRGRWQSSVLSSVTVTRSISPQKQYVHGFSRSACRKR